MKSQMMKTSTAPSVTSAIPMTCQSAKIFGLGNAITEDSHIKVARLPTCWQVLRCLVWHIKEGQSDHQSKWESAKLVLTKVNVFYERANIPIITERKACERIIQLLDENAKIRAIPVKRRSTSSIPEKLKEMEDNLAKTFPLWPATAEQLIRNVDDLAFLKSMKTDRAATFGSYDKVLAEKVQ